MARVNFRGLFQSIFGKRPENGSSLPTYRLLSTWDSGFSPFSGRAWDVATVRAAVDAWARNAAKIQPRHIRRTGGRWEGLSDNIDRILQTNPNPYMTAYAFYYRVAAQFAIYNNAFILPVFDGGSLTAVYPINASRVELVEEIGEMYARLTFATGSVWTCPYSQLVHLRRHYLDNDIFGDDNRPLVPILETANAFNQSLSKFAQLVSVIRGVLKIATPTKTEDLNARRDDFIKDNLKMENNGSGVIVTDSKYDYTPITSKEMPLPTGQLDFVRKEIHDYFGVSDKIVQNTADAKEMDAFYRGELSPFYMQLAQGLTRAIFTEREQGFGNEIICELNRLQFAPLNDRKEVAKFLTDVGALTLDQILDIFGYDPIGGEEGARRVQTLNMVNAQIIDKYQLGSTGQSTEEPPKDPPPADPPPKKPEDDPAQEPKDGKEGQ